MIAHEEHPHCASPHMKLPCTRDVAKVVSYVDDDVATPVPLASELTPYADRVFQVQLVNQISISYMPPPSWLERLRWRRWLPKHPCRGFECSPPLHHTVPVPFWCHFERYGMKLQT